MNVVQDLSGVEKCSPELAGSTPEQRGNTGSEPNGAGETAGSEPNGAGESAAAHNGHMPNAAMAGKHGDDVSSWSVVSRPSDMNSVGRYNSYSSCLMPCIFYSKLCYVNINVITFRPQDCKLN